ncbi:MAG: sigma 54-interacting transcriptional regulator [Pseudomonadota bacterium]
MVLGEQHTLEITGLTTSLAARGAPARGLVLSVESGSRAGQRVSLSSRPLKIGAGGDCDLVLDDPTVSRQHAELLPALQGILVRDLGSRNGTRVNGALVREALVTPGREFLVGETRLRLHDGGAPQVAPSTRERFGGLVGSSTSMREVFAVLELAAPSDATVLIQGPSGSGKEVAARALHDHSRRSTGPFVVFDCSSVSRELLQSALFGHKKGAFTGAVSDRGGAFVEASGGTLFLDELGELPVDSQTHLLRVLETAQVTPVGGDRAVKVDVRVVAATHRELFEMVEAKSFRLDLFHRLAVVHLRLPALDERLEDLPILIRHFYEGRGVEPGVIDGPNLSQLRHHAFEGNVRELRNILERSWVLGGGGSTRFADLRLWLGPTQTARGVSPATLDVDAGLPFKEAKEKLLDDFEARYLPELMARFGDNLSAAARHAGLSRRHLRALLVKHGLKGEDA